MRQLTLIGLLALSIVAAADPATPDASATAAVFSAAEIAIIRDYYSERGGGSKTAAPRKGKGLPPGIAKNLRRGKPLPPGIAKRHLPGELHQKLPAPPDGHERIVVPGKILLVEIATQVVRDVLTDVLF